MTDRYIEGWKRAREQCADLADWDRDVPYGFASELRALPVPEPAPDPRDAEIAEVTAQRDALRSVVLNLGGLSWWDCADPAMQDAMEAAGLIEPIVAAEDDPDGDYRAGDDIYVLTTLGTAALARSAP